MSAFSIHHLIVMTILTQYQKVRDQIDTFERLRTKLTYDVKVEDQICSLPQYFLLSYLRLGCIQEPYLGLYPKHLKSQ